MRRPDRNFTRTVFAACMLAVALVTVGCGNDNSSSGPSPTPTSAVTPSPTPLPSPTIVAITIVSSVPSLNGVLGGLDIGASGGGFLVAYAAAATASTSAIYGVRLGADGSVLDTTPFLVSVAQSDAFLADPSWNAPAVGFDGKSYAVAYAGTGMRQGFPAATITAVLVDAQQTIGTPTDLAETVLFGMCETAVVPPPTIAGTPTAAFAALWPFEEGCINTPVANLLAGAFATPQGTALSVSEIDGLLPPVGSTPPIVSSAASVASSATTTVAAWTEAELGSTETNVELALLSSDGVERVKLATGAHGFFVQPAIASDGEDYLVVWQATTSEIRGARFHPGIGSLDGPDGFLIARGKFLLAPRVAFGHGTYLVAFADWESPFDGLLGTVAISPAGALTSIENDTSGQRFAYVAVAFSGDTFVVAFTRPEASPSKNASLEALLIRP